MASKRISKIKADLGLEPNGNVEKYTTERCYQHLDTHVPMADTHQSRENVVKETDYIKYNVLYAHAQYVGIVHGSSVRNYTTPRNRATMG